MAALRKMSFSCVNLCAIGAGTARTAFQLSELCQHIHVILSLAGTGLVACDRVGKEG